MLSHTYKCTIVVHWFDNFSYKEQNMQVIILYFNHKPQKLRARIGERTHIITFGHHSSFQNIDVIIWATITTAYALNSTVVSGIIRKTMY